MNVDDVYLDKSESFFDTHVRTTFVLTLLLNLIIGHSMIFGEISAYVWLETWDNLHTPNAHWLAYCHLRILTREVVEMPNYLVVPIW